MKKSPIIFRYVKIGWLVAKRNFLSLFKKKITCAEGCAEQSRAKVEGKLFLAAEHQFLFGNAEKASKSALADSSKVISAKQKSNDKKNTNGTICTTHLDSKEQQQLYQRRLSNLKQTTYYPIGVGGFIGLF